MKRYSVYLRGPDAYSVWPECWGPNGKPGKLLAQVATLKEAKEVLRRVPHDNWLIRDHERRRWISIYDLRKR
ncbi:MAG: hypothetical protein NZM31_00250 [Gemmatales bacterium]|nr:hypothetical protein [Gemmatales bacterium]MDW8385423.1 hypothetical protein [Gemmatales bacterium]